MSLKSLVVLQSFLTLWLLAIMMMVTNEVPTPRQLGGSYFAAAMVISTVSSNSKNDES